MIKVLVKLRGKENSDLVHVEISNLLIYRAQSSNQEMAWLDFLLKKNLRRPLFIAITLKVNESCLWSLLKL